MTRKKENAINDIMEIIKKSWTWEKLTEEEKARFCDFIHKNKIKGEKTINTHYRLFLDCCGYKPIGWRDDPKYPAF